MTTLKSKLAQIKIKRDATFITFLQQITGN